MIKDLNYSTEQMSDQFVKYHANIGKLNLTLHYFTGPDTGDAHDHPLPFRTTILAGSYIEEIWSQDQTGLWFPSIAHRKPGCTHRVEATDIHRIIELPQGECITSVQWHLDGSERREPRFWQLDGFNSRSRQWNGEWTKWTD